jgi:hypothetical protein
MGYRGIVRGAIIELEDGAALPEGAEVEVTLAGIPRDSPPARGTPRAVLEILDQPPLCTPDDVDALLRAIQEARRPADYRGVFSREEAEA